MIPRVVRSNGVEVFAVRVGCNEVGGSSIDCGQWFTRYDEGCSAGCTPSFSSFPTYQLQMSRCEVKFVIAFGCLQDAGIELHFPIASFVCVSGELVWSLWIIC